MANDVTLENGIIRLGPEAMARWARHFATHPADRKMRDLIVEYATERGGLTLEFWKRKYGNWFGDPIIMLPERIAQELDVPVSELDRIWAETCAWVRPRLDADPE